MQVSPAERLILDGINLLLRINAAPADPVAQAKHFAHLGQAIPEWIMSYHAAVNPPANSN